MLSQPDVNQMIAHGAQLLQQGDCARAIKVFHSVVMRAPENWSGWLNLAVCLVHAKDYATAEKLFRKILDTFAGNSAAEGVAWYNLGTMYGMQGQKAAQRDALKRSVTIAPRSAEIWNSLGHAHKELGEHAEALHAFERTTQLDPGHMPAWMNLGFMRGKIGDHKGAADATRTALTLHPQDPDAWSILGSHLFASHDLNGAISAYKESLALNSKDSSTWSALGEALVTEGDLQGAIDAFTRALAVDPACEDARSHLLALNASPSPRCAPGPVRDIAISPEHAPLQSKTGVDYIMKGDLVAAERSFREAVIAHPESAGDWSNLGMCLLCLERYEEAIHALSRATHLKPDYATAWNGLGGAYLKLRRFADARAALERAARIRLDYPSPWVNLARLHALQGNVQAARACAKRAVKIDPNLPEAREILSDLVKIEKRTN